METVLLYIALNVALFSSLYLLAKTVETAAWYLIENYDKIVAQLENYFVDSAEK